MGLGDFSLGALRLLLELAPAIIVAHRTRLALLGECGRTIAVLAEAMLAASVLLLAAELLGLVSLEEPAALIPVLLAVALLSLRLPRAAATPAEPVQAAPALVVERGSHRGALEVARLRPAELSAAFAVLIVAAEWCLHSVNSLGSGMTSFDTLWYHMPFAARFAQSASVTGIQFTQADPFVAYYPANSELLNGLGIGALHGDFLSPLLNLAWLSLALLACWQLGRRWRVAPQTLTAGCLLCGLPVLVTTQPGQAFNDIFGLAALLTAAALAVHARGRPGALLAVGLSLGLAVGTKITFLVPALALIVALTALSPPRRRLRALLALLAGTAATGGWWYLRDLIDVGNPLGLGLRIGPLRLPGPRSPLAEASQQTVASQISHLSLWGSRFAPGLSHALGPLWPLVLLLCAAGVIGGLLLARDPVLRALAATALLAAVSYLFLPTGASGIEQGTTTFEANLRYVTPAIALAIVLVPIVLHERFPRVLRLTGPLLLLVLVATQLEHALWPQQSGRQAAFLLAGAALAVLVYATTVLIRRLPRAGAAGLAAAIALLVAGGAYAAQRHYFARRYLLGYGSEPALGTIYRWAQHVSNARIALYGSVLQYPLYGARNTNVVDYLGEAARDGGFRPISSCLTFRRALAAGDYSWLVIVLPGPTVALPTAWFQTDRSLRLVLHPAAGAFVFRVQRTAQPATCS